VNVHKPNLVIRLSCAILKLHHRQQHTIEPEPMHTIGENQNIFSGFVHDLYSRYPNCVLEIARLVWRFRKYEISQSHSFSHTHSHALSTTSHSTSMRIRATINVSQVSQLMNHCNSQLVLCQVVLGRHGELVAFLDLDGIVTVGI
jgi:hypothetical protein